MGYGLIVEKRQDGIERRDQQFHKKNVLQLEECISTSRIVN